MGYQRGIAQALRAQGLAVVEYAGWETRGSSSFNPRGLVVHHTGPWSTIDGMVRLCIRGRSDLPGPLCHIVLDPVGRCHVIAAGRANHAGSGGWRGLSGNSSVFGIEAIHDGARSTPWPGAQVDAYHRAAAALCRAYNFDPGYVCGHKEWRPGDKIDPIVLDMGVFRARVADVLAGVPPPAPARQPQEGVVPVNRPPVKILTHPNWGGGYLVVTDDGGVFSFGGAPFHGSLGGVALSKPIVDAEVTASGGGYWMMGADGGMFAFGDAAYHGRVEYVG